MTSKPGTDGSTRRPAQARRRPRSLAVILAVCFAVWLSAVPGAASANPVVTPYVECYTVNSDGSYSIVLSYTKTTAGTANIPLGTRNIAYPAKFQGIQPTQFKAGTWRGVFSVKISQADMYANPRWVLDGYTLDYTKVGSMAACSPSTPLPALGNGAAIALVLVGAGAFGVVWMRRRVPGSAAPA
ncbi:MAG TPA: hypothetical protein VFG13_19900 [Blastococcus sp.]|nr:hypothetical protein [Blastococcus sp.]